MKLNGMGSKQFQTLSSRPSWKLLLGGIDFISQMTSVKAISFSPPTLCCPGILTISHIESARYLEFPNGCWEMENLNNQSASVSRDGSHILSS